MRPWSVVTLVVLALLVIVFRWIWKAALRECAFLADRVDAADALRRLVRVRSGTEIDILGLDLRLLVLRPAWRGLLEGWLRSGARVRYLVQEAADDGRRALGESAAAGSGGEVKLFVLKAGERDSALALDARDFHFIVFRGPDQLWLEGGHADGGLVALDCEYVPRATEDERWGPRSEDFEGLVAKADEVGRKDEDGRGQRREAEDVVVLILHPSAFILSPFPGD